MGKPSVAKVDTSRYKTVDDILDHLDEIVGEVRDRKTSLEHSLDLLDEAVALGSKAVDLVDTADPGDAAAPGADDGPKSR